MKERANDSSGDDDSDEDTDDPSMQSPQSVTEVSRHIACCHSSMGSTFLRLGIGELIDMSYILKIEYRCN